MLPVPRWVASKLALVRASRTTAKGDIVCLPDLARACCSIDSDTYGAPRPNRALRYYKIFEHFVLGQALVAESVCQAKGGRGVRKDHHIRHLWQDAGANRRRQVIHTPPVAWIVLWCDHRRRAVGQVPIRGDGIQQFLVDGAQGTVVRPERTLKRARFSSLLLNLQAELKPGGERQGRFQTASERRRYNRLDATD